MTGKLGDLDQSIEIGEVALELTAASDGRRAWLSFNLGQYLYDRFQRLGELNDLDRGIGHTVQAISSPNLDVQIKAGRLMNLSCFLARRFEWSGEL